MAASDVPPSEPSASTEATDLTRPYADGTPYSLTQSHRVDSHVGRPDGGRRGLIDWLFRSRTSGRITIAQFPNAALWVWLAATVLQRFWDPRIAGHDVLRWLSTGALVVWAGDEVLRGINPFRRILGAGVLALTAWSLLR